MCLLGKAMLSEEEENDAKNAFCNNQNIEILVFISNLTLKESFNAYFKL